MFYVIYGIVLIIFFLISKKYKELHIKFTVPMYLIVCGAYFLYSKQVYRELIFDNNIIFDEMVPLGTTEVIKERIIEIRETYINENLYTSVSYEAYQPYLNGFINPTLDILQDEEIKLKITLEKGYFGDYIIKLPKYNNESIIQVLSFESDKLKNKNIFDMYNIEENSYPEELKINIPANAKLEDNYSFYLILKVNSNRIVYNNVNISGIRTIEDSDFCIEFQNSKTEQEKLRLIISEEELLNSKIPFSLKSISPYSSIGLNIPIDMKFYNPFTYEYEHYDTFIFDEDDTFLQGLKPTELLESLYIDEPRETQRGYTLLLPKQSFSVELSDSHKSLFLKEEYPFLNFVTTKGGSIIVGNNKNFSFEEPYYNLIIKAPSLLSVRLTDLDNNPVKGKSFDLYQKNIDNSVGEKVGNIGYLVNRDGYLQNKNSEIYENLILTGKSEYNYKVSNIILVPFSVNEIEKHKRFYLVENTNDENPIKISVEIDKDRQFKSNVEVVNNNRLNYSHTGEDKIFYNKIDAEINFYSLYDVKLILK